MASLLILAILYWLVSPGKGYLSGFTTFFAFLFAASNSVSTAKAPPKLKGQVNHAQVQLMSLVL